MRVSLTIIWFLILFGCATTNSFVLTGGNRAGGSVTLTCTYDILTNCGTTPTADMNRLAIQACKRWGYQSASPFGGYRRLPINDYTGNIEISYQCLGDLER